MPRQLFKYLILAFIVSCLFALNAQGQTDNSKQSNNNISLLSQLNQNNMALSPSSDNPFESLLNGLEISASGFYQNLPQFRYQDSGNFFQQLLDQFLHFIEAQCFSTIPALISWLFSIVKQFFLNNDFTQIDSTSTSSNDIRLLLNKFNATIYGIALDLSLLLFILSIWRYWADAAWKGSSNLMGAVGRLIFAISLLLAWSSIYKFQIELSNELMTALVLDQNGNIQFLDIAVSNIFSNLFAGGLSAGIIGTALSTANISSMIAPIAQGLMPLVEIIAPIIFCLLAIVLIYQLVYIIVLKAVQSALLTAQYVFAPIFIILIANPVTDNIGTGFIRSFVEVSLWNFIWIGLLKILLILLFSNMDPWGKLLTAIGILQIMMDVPQFLSHAKISATSDFINPRFFVKALKSASGYDKAMKQAREILPFPSIKSTNKNTDKDTDNLKGENQSPSTPTANFSFADNAKQVCPLPQKISLSDPQVISQPSGKDSFKSNEKTESQHYQQDKDRTNKDEQAGQHRQNFQSFPLNNALAATSLSSQTACVAATNGNSAIAISSANSTAIALAIAIAAINNRFGETGSSTNYPPSKGAPPKPPAGPSPSKGQDNKPNSPNNNNSPDLGNNRRPSPKPPTSGSTPDFDLGPDNKTIGFASTLSHKSDTGKKPNSISEAHHNNKPYESLSSINQSSPLHASTSPENIISNSLLGSAPSHLSKPATVIASPSAGSKPSDHKPPGPKPFGSLSNHNTDINYTDKPSVSSIYSIENSNLSSQPESFSNFIDRPAPVFKLIHAFHTGRFNYYCQKDSNKSPGPSNTLFFPPFLKGQNLCKSCSDQHSYDLIFVHGNFPTLMGIPPIYPEPNKT